MVHRQTVDLQPAYDLICFLIEIYIICENFAIFIRGGGQSNVWASDTPLSLARYRSSNAFTINKCSTRCLRANFQARDNPDKIRSRWSVQRLLRSELTLNFVRNCQENGLQQTNFYVPYGNVFYEYVDMWNWLQRTLLQSANGVVVTVV